MTAPGADLVGLGKALQAAAVGVAARPATIAAGIGRLASGLAAVTTTTIARGVGLERAPTYEADPRDRRFADPTWEKNPAFFALRQEFLAVSALARELVGGAGLDPRTERKALFALGLLLDALAPTNFLVTNPAALKRAFETGGTSVWKGATQFLDDALHNGGRPRQVDTSSFEIGVNLAATPCQVVFRNDLIEVLQYGAQTDRVRATPLLCSPPWINKYYVMDLAPGRSFVEWAVQHERTVFAISYRNPDAEMVDVTMDDYLVDGLVAALDVVAEITGSPTVDIVGLCLGGVLSAATAAYLQDKGDARIGTLTLLNTMLDYSDPGVLAMFTELPTIEALEVQMAATGYLDGAEMAATFDALRPNDLLFNYVVSNWLMGDKPPAFDILAWNSDNTRLPAAMHSFYLRSLYVDNRLATGTMDLAGSRIDLSVLKNDAYVVSAENDHIVPWQSAYATTQLVSGSVRFVLSSGGHIAGIVNPPGPKGWYLLADDPDATTTGVLPASPAAWRKTTTRQPGSWWEDWARWSAASSGDLVAPPGAGSTAHPPLGPGPGTYVLG